MRACLGVPCPFRSRGDRCDFVWSLSPSLSVQFVRRLRRRESQARARFVKCGPSMRRNRLHGGVASRACFEFIAPHANTPSRVRVRFWLNSQNRVVPRSIASRECAMSTLIRLVRANARLSMRARPCLVFFFVRFLCWGQFQWCAHETYLCRRAFSCRTDYMRCKSDERAIIKHGGVRAAWLSCVGPSVLTVD